MHEDMVAYKLSSDSKQNLGRCLFWKDNIIHKSA